jgi:hypothetical protein
MKHQGGDPAETALRCAVLPDPSMGESTLGERERILSSFSNKGNRWTGPRNFFLPKGNPS